MRKTAGSLTPVVWALVPIKPRGVGKSRLSGVLSDGARDRLVEAMLDHVIGTLQQSGSIDRILLLGPMRTRWAQGTAHLPDHGQDLNSALQLTLTDLGQAIEQPDRLLIMAADLPCVSRQDIARMAQLPAHTFGLAVDRDGRGSNALSLPWPESIDFAFQYGLHSAPKHYEEALRLGLHVEKIHSHGLSKDIDVPADLKDARHLMPLTA